jgi:hypothetical protein
MNRKRKVRARFRTSGIAQATESAHRYLNPSFRERLRRKTNRHLINADFHHTSDGGRFPKSLVESPLYEAIRYVRSRPYKILHDNTLPEYDPQFADTINQYVLEAILTDQPGMLRDLAIILELCGAQRALGAKHIPWVYYGASAALRYLDKGELPTKLEVIDGAIRQRALEELLLADLPNSALSLKIEDLTKNRSPLHWPHIFRLLDLQELPT